MQFVSTRDARLECPTTLADALVAGLARDGGLYVPASLPPFDVANYDGLESLSDVAKRLLSPFFAGSTLAPDLAGICEEAFDFPVPTVPIDGSEVLELFHGGYGYLMDYPIERFWRDLRVHSILEGTNQIMRVIVSRDLLRQ